MIGTKVHITGIVQGVGFRPFIYGQAIRLELTGWVCNTSAGVDIEVNGEPDRISQFIQAIKNDTPPLARVDSIEWHQTLPHHYNSFVIVESIAISDAFQPISPDICICPDCLDELFDPEDRRYRYPFINCTNCGPRLTIIDDIPYDRPNTTMRGFEMCEACKTEYRDPTNRRFHAQPIACPECGPQVSLIYPEKNKISPDPENLMGDDAILETQKLIINGKIVAVKGLGGFHLACDATNPVVVAELRRRKLRVDKPFAVMMPDLATVEAHCMIEEQERERVLSRERPIIIIRRREGSTIASEITPKQDTLGVMLPYTPLHYLLFAHPGVRSQSVQGDKPSIIPPLVMTSGNISEEPIAVTNDEALTRLSGLADAFLIHNRPIRTRCDDSVIRVYQGTTFPLRRSRGYAPYPVHLPFDSPQLLATGAELKNTFCIARDRYAFLSHHIGDMENFETLNSYEDSISHYESLFRIKPEALAYDLHPNYLATRYALDRAQRESLIPVGVQHHHAHIAACMVENSLPKDHPVIGVAFDGTGYGEDGAIWGGEFLLADYKGYQRIYRLKYMPLPGGDAAIRNPARIALAYLWASGFDWDTNLYPVTTFSAEELSVLRSQLELKINTPNTSSMGRLFDAVAALIGIRQTVNYEAQAAIELEALADLDENGEYPFSIESIRDQPQVIFQINPLLLIESIITDLNKSITTPTISARFHNSIARMVCHVSNEIHKEFGLDDVVLSGGVWQNIALLQRTINLLKAHNFTVHIHHQVPTNDGGLALGQAAVAITKITS
jgi:hydrogenase maturation protein HypF